jgi:hypothetical protein
MPIEQTISAVSVGYSQQLAQIYKRKKISMHYKRVTKNNSNLLWEVCPICFLHQFSPVKDEHNEIKEKIASRKAALNQHTTLTYHHLHSIPSLCRHSIPVKNSCVELK